MALARAGLIVSVAYLVARVLGYVRVVVITSTIGEGAELEAFFAAFRIPDLIFQLVAAGTVAAALVPMVAGELGTGRAGRAWRIVSTIATLMTVALVALVGIGVPRGTLARAADRAGVRGRAAGAHDRAHPADAPRADVPGARRRGDERAQRAPAVRRVRGRPDRL